MIVAGDGEHLSAVLFHPENAHSLRNVQRHQPSRLLLQQAGIDRGNCALEGDSEAKRTRASAFPPQATVVARERFGGAGSALRRRERM